MQRAACAHRGGHMALALACYREALAVARQGLNAAPGHLSESLSAWVSSAQCLAGLRVDEGSTSLAAQALADAHVALVEMVVREPLSSARRQAAIWHSHETHAALLRHLDEHGADPQVERALRAGCVGFSAGMSTRH